MASGPWLLKNSIARSCDDLYLIVHSVQGLKSGAYRFGREQRTLELLKEGLFRVEAYRLGLEQQLPADACVDIFFLANLERILERYGNRGYGAVQLEAGVLGGGCTWLRMPCAWERLV